MTQPAQSIDTLLEQQEALLKGAVARCMQNLAAAQRAGAGIGAASTELARAQRVLRDYQASQAREQAGGKFATVSEAVRYVIAQGYLVKERSAADHIKGNLARQADGSYLKAHVDDYALRTWDNPRQAAETAASEEGDGYKARLTKATAELAELKLAERKGNLLDAAEEEARDAAVLLGIRRHLEIGVPERIKGMIADLAGLLSEEQAALAMTRLPEWIEMEMERLAESFDQLAQAGGVE